MIMNSRLRSTSRVLLALLMTMAVAGAAAEDVSTTAPAERPLAPDWSLDTADGRDINFYRDTAGHPAVLVFWASWCPYCRELFPHIESVRQAFSARGVQFYALNVWEDGDPVAYFRQRGIGLTLLLAADLVGEDYGVTGTPGVYVTDREHRVIYQRRRGDKPEEVAGALSAALEQALAQEPGLSPAAAPQ